MKIIIYTKIGCVYCQKIKDWMNEKQLPYEEIDISKVNDSILLQEIKGVPYTIIKMQDQDIKVLGFNQTRLLEVINQLNI